MSANKILFFGVSDLLCEDGDTLSNVALKNLKYIADTTGAVLVDMSVWGKCENSRKYMDKVCEKAGVKIYARVKDGDGKFVERAKKMVESLKAKKMAFLFSDYCETTYGFDAVPKRQLFNSKGKLLKKPLADRVIKVLS